MKSILTAAVLLVLPSASPAAVITFDSIDSFYSNGRIERIDDVVFSTGVIPNSSFPDGFEWRNFGTTHALNYYGEQGEYFEFDSPVTLNSIDFGEGCCGDPETVTVSLYDTGDSFLSSLTFDWTDIWTTYLFAENNVSKVVMEFTGGTDFYNEGRLHAWYGIDNIDYAEAVDSAPEPVQVPGLTPVPLPASGLLILGGLFGLGVLRLRQMS